MCNLKVGLEPKKSPSHCCTELLLCVARQYNCTANYISLFVAVGSLPVITSNTFTSNDTAFCGSCGWLPEPSLIWTDTQGNRVIPSMGNVYKDEKSFYCIFSIIFLPNASNITCTVSNSINQSKYDSRQIRETGLPEACRDQYSRYIVFWPCLTYLLVCIGYICHQSMKLSKYLKRFIAT
uniref:Butyrophilin subfamily 3 member A2-like Ig-C domain-containing protein n=1 Tax=Xenopus tropicalis TaxID=8364 RepID=A0A803KEW7_XENTR